ncbi:MAG TPA: class I SAM-dependent methyltransferase, partial [Candidatus Melainabacteria bacterium]|nr:class I SAM-dependent methyltransferase [Candidatus Melainabacteria bacterium]
EEGDDRTFYSMIYEEFDVGLAFASLRIDLYRSFLTWFKTMMENRTSATIIDIGCGNGVLTCLLSANFPEARFIGFDISEAGIDSAVKLKKKLSLDNVEFLSGDLNSLPEELENIEADIAFSVASLDPDQQFEENAVNRSLFDLWRELEQNRKQSGEDLSKLVSNLLKSNGGIFICFDKLVRPLQQMRRLQAMVAAGLKPDFAASTWLQYTDVQGEPVILPVLLG